MNEEMSTRKELRKAVYRNEYKCYDNGNLASIRRKAWQSFQFKNQISSNPLSETELKKKYYKWLKIKNLNNESRKSN
jgi:hypothetical protein